MDYGNPELQRCCKESAQGQPFTSCNIFEPNLEAFKHAYPIILSAPFPNIILNETRIAYKSDLFPKKTFYRFWHPNQIYLEFIIQNSLYFPSETTIFQGLVTIMNQYGDKCYMWKSCWESPFHALAQLNCHVAQKLFDLKRIYDDRVHFIGLANEGTYYDFLHLKSKDLIPK